MLSLAYKQPDYNTIVEVARKLKASRYLNRLIADGLKARPFVSQLSVPEKHLSEILVDNRL